MSSRRSSLLLLTALGALAACRGFEDTARAPDPMFPPIRSALPLGTFSVSLSVQDLAKSRAFYEKLGFEALVGVRRELVEAPLYVVEVVIEAAHVGASAAGLAEAAAVEA